MKYYMLRLYTLLQSDNSIIDKSAVYGHDNEISAMKQYYKMLASDIDDVTKPMVMCCVMNDNGIVIAKQKFTHAIPNTENEPTYQDTNSAAE